MNVRAKNKVNENTFESPSIAIEKIADANTVVGDSIVTISGAQVIPLSSITVVNLGGGGEFGDVKTFREADGFKLAGGNGTVVTVKPRGFLIDDGKGCRLLKMDEGIVNTLIDKTEEFVTRISNND